MFDGQKEYDDNGIVCYWDAEEEGWVTSEQYASQRFLKLLYSLDDFEGFDE